MKPNYVKAIALIERNFCPLNEEEKYTLCGIMHPVRFNKHKIIIKQGDIATTFYFIEKGMCHTYMMKNNKPCTLQFDYDGHFIILMESFLSEMPTELTVAALESMRCYAIEKVEFEQAAHTRVNLQLLLRKVIEQNILRLTRYRRLMRNENSAQRYQIMCQYHPEVIRRAPLVHIASMLHMAPATLSRTRKAQWESQEAL